MRNPRIILPLLALGVVASFYYAWQNMPRVEYAPERPVTATTVSDSPAGKAKSEDSIDFSGGKQRRFSKPRRNLFGELYPPPKIVKPVVTEAPVVAAPPVAAPVVVEPVVTAPLGPIQTASMRMPSFQILGYLEKEQQLTAFVSLQNEIYLVKQDQLLTDEFRVTQLTREKITFARTTGKGEVSLALSDKTGGTAIPGGQVPPRLLPNRPAPRPLMPFAPPLPDDTGKD